MENKLPVYELEISDDENKAVNFVALVDNPAIERNFFAFNNQFKFVADKERRIITGALMTADLPIYRRNDKMGEFYVIFRKEQIEKIVQKFFAKGFNNNVNEMHNPAKVVDGVVMFESFISDKQRGVLAPKGFEDMPEGSWFGSYFVENEEVWNKVKEGTFQGFSVEGDFDIVPKEETLESKILEIVKKINP
jgi:hypothetical protein